MVNIPLSRQRCAFLITADDTIIRKRFLGGITLAVQAIPPIATHFSIAWSVCLSHSCTLVKPTDLDAIWQVHLWGPWTHCVRWGSLIPQGKGWFGVKPRSQSMQLQIAAATWQVQTSESAFFQTTFVFVDIRCAISCQVSLNVLKMYNCNFCFSF